MPTWIALLRGVNVGGKHLLPMKQLVADIESLGGTSVRTYIQSGNAVFQSPRRSATRFATDLASQIEQSRGFRPAVLVMPATKLEMASAANPFIDAEPRAMHYYFCVQPPSSPNMDAIETATAPSERHALIDQVFYLHAPDGIGRSKLAAKVEQSLDVATTARNGRTVQKLIELANA